MSEVKKTPVEIGDCIGFRGAVSISDEELQKRVDFLEEHSKEFSKLVIKAENELYIKELLRRNERLQHQLDQYKNNWEELKEYIEKFPGISYASSEKVDGERLSGKLIPTTKVLNKMKELEEDK